MRLQLDTYRKHLALEVQLNRSFHVCDLSSVYVIAKSKTKGDKGKQNVAESMGTNSVDALECLKHTTCFGANFLKDGEDPSLKVQFIHYNNYNCYLKIMYF